MPVSVSLVLSFLCMVQIILGSIKVAEWPPFGK